MKLRPKGRWGRWGFATILTGLLVYTLVAGAGRLYAEDNGEAEYRVKLAFLYNFTRFIQWPPEAFSGPEAPLNICVAGPNPFLGSIAEGFQGRAALGHPLRIRQLRAGDNPAACQILFVRSSNKTSAEKLLTSLKGSNTLTIGENPDFTVEGGLVNFTLHDDKLRFEINLGAAQQSPLKISSKLLSLATIVNGGKDPVTARRH
jgi:hypothetical protein